MEKKFRDIFLIGLIFYYIFNYFMYDYLLYLMINFNLKILIVCKFLIREINI